MDRPTDRHDNEIKSYVCVFIVIENTGAIHTGTPQTFLVMIKTYLEGEREGKRGGGERERDTHTYTQRDMKTGMTTRANHTHVRLYRNWKHWGHLH